MFKSYFPISSETVAIVFKHKLTSELYQLTLWNFINKNVSNIYKFTTNKNFKEVVAKIELFVFFSCAFDTIPHNSIFYKLSCLGLSSNIISILRLLYTDSGLGWHISLRLLSNWYRCQTRLSAWSNFVFPVSQ